MIDGWLWEIVSWLLLAVFFWVIAHTWLIRPLIQAIERDMGREFFPFIDRIWPR